VEPRTIATAHAAGRAAIGGALLAAPEAITAGWIGKHARRGPVTVLARALGARDAALGLGVLGTLGDAQAVKPWVAACLAADAVDLIATLALRDELPAQGVAAVAAMAGGSVLLGAWLLTALD